MLQQQQKVSDLTRPGPRPGEYVYMYIEREAEGDLGYTQFPPVVLYGNTFVCNRSVPIHGSGVVGAQHHQRARARPIRRRDQ